MDRIELDDMSLREPGRSSELFSETRSMSNEPQRRERQTAPRKSDRCVVSEKPSNVGGEKAARPSQRGGDPSAARRGGELVKSLLDRITERARKHKREAFTNLFHHLDKDLLETSFRELRKDAAPGADEVSKEDYGAELEKRLEQLVTSLHKETYRPQPVRRKYIPKPNGKLRPLGIPATEDKLVQRAVAKVLERIYEEDFYDFSFGFRPRRSCHDALRELSRKIGTKRTHWIVEADIRGFYDNLSHDWLMKMIEHRVSDPRMLALIRRFLGAGVIEEGKYLETEKGAPQGGSFSPLLSNVYLHYVLDDWFEQVVKRHCRGEAYLIRYADDFVGCFEHKHDAELFDRELQRRLAKFGLEVEPSKTKIFAFGRFGVRDARRAGKKTADVFDFLGITHYCGLSRKGRFKLKWRTSSQRFRTKLRAMNDWIRDHRTDPMKEIWQMVNKKLQGHYQYYGVSDNWPNLIRFRRLVVMHLYRCMNRRSQRRSFTLPAFFAHLNRFRIVEPKRLIDLNSAFV
jgi:RNA-directed DNA polymerase